MPRKSPALDRGRRAVSMLHQIPGEAPCFCCPRWLGSGPDGACAYGNFRFGIVRPSVDGAAANSGSPPRPGSPDDRGSAVTADLLGRLAVVVGGVDRRWYGALLASFFGRPTPSRRVEGFAPGGRHQDWRGWPRKAPTPPPCLVLRCG